MRRGTLCVCEGGSFSIPNGVIGILNRVFAPAKGWLCACEETAFAPAKAGLCDCNLILYCDAILKFVTHTGKRETIELRKTPLR